MIASKRSVKGALFVCPARPALMAGLWRDSAKSWRDYGGIVGGIGACVCRDNTDIIGARDDLPATQERTMQKYNGVTQYGPAIRQYLGAPTQDNRKLLKARHRVECGWYMKFGFSYQNNNWAYWAKNVSVKVGYYVC